MATNSFGVLKKSFSLLTLTLRYKTLPVFFSKTLLWLLQVAGLSKGSRKGLWASGEACLKKQPYAIWVFTYRAKISSETKMFTSFHAVKQRLLPGFSAGVC